ncbi:MAG: transketolase C-terminal domain-containing protein [Candidatus ainarchaeum sp.]|nr:transketolase C-terminal domain-containing protein [Candidatus ainarchaeum sp.]
MKKVEESSIAVAIGAKLARVQVFPMYPITPSTHIQEQIAEYVNSGELEAELIDVESEHSALSAAVGAVAAGSRTFTATSSQGFALMFEVLPIASGMRLPIVMAVANRALSAPINIWNDHSDSVSARDQGWIQLYVESGQEALDTTIQAFKIAEDKNVLLPVMVNLDGFSLTHVFEEIDEPEQKEVDAFLPAYKPEHFLDVKNPKTFGPIAFPDSYMEFKKQQQDAMIKSLETIKKVNSEFAKKFGRPYGNGLIDTYKMADAKFAIIAMGTVCGTARVVVDELRKKGKKAGLIKLRCLRPFPTEDLLRATKGLKALGVIDRHVSLGFEGPLFADLKAVLNSNLKMAGFIAGLGGRDVSMKHLHKVFSEIEKAKPKGSWLL